jgi:hypothetical protein
MEDQTMGLLATLEVDSHKRLARDGTIIRTNLILPFLGKGHASSLHV